MKFLPIFKHGLAYKKKVPINWCLSCKIGLANEEVVNGACERCGGIIEKREKEQWMLAITKYAERLYDDLDTVDYLEKIKIGQKNWIGKSEGALLKFPISNFQFSIDVFTTRPDTLFGATYMVLAPDHEAVEKLKSKIENWKEVAQYISQAKKKTEIERTTEGKEKTGAELKGIKAINPANKEKIPIFIADYVLKEYGTGAIMAVPAHDTRDYEFAKKFGLSIKEVISGGDIKKEAFVGVGKLVNSSGFNGLISEEAKEKITEFVGGKTTTTYKLRDWVFSRQRYWGEPIPLIFCEKDGWVAVSEKDLPVELPKVEKYEPTDTGESPLSKIESWVNIKCPSCGGNARRETDTMPNWAGSSWYYLAYVMQGISDFQFPISEYKKTFNHWISVDWYNGGMEHTTLHLLYSRFWHKFLFDIGVVSSAEPYKKRTSHGMVLALGGEKMSKSKGNVVNPDDTIKTFGADTLRIYEMFIGPFDQSVVWSRESIIGPHRFLERVWNLKNKVGEGEIDPALEKVLNRAIKNITEDIETMGFNTLVSELMTLSNQMEKTTISRKTYETFLKLLAPIAPHITEEIWHLLGNKNSIHSEAWPACDFSKLEDSTVTIMVQVNGKIRGKFMVAREMDENEIKNMALELPSVKSWLKDMGPKRIIYIKDKLVSIVV